MPHAHQRSGPDLAPHRATARELCARGIRWLIPVRVLLGYPLGNQPFRPSAGMQASRDKAGTRTDKGRGREAHEREAYKQNAYFGRGEPVEPGTRGLALFDEVTP